MIYVIGDPTEDTIIIEGKIKKSFGGTVIYSSLAIKRLGCDVGVVCKGSDEMKALFVNLGIDTSYFYKTSHTIKFENVYIADKREQKAEQGQGTFIFLKDIPTDVFLSKAILVGPVLQEVDAEIVKAERQGILMVDIQGFLRHLSSNGEVFLEVSEETEKAIRYCDILKANQEEAQAITLTDDIENSCSILHKMGPKIIIITLGSKGSCIFDGSQVYKINSFKADIADLTGAGDVYNAAFLVKFLESGSISKAGRFASVAASLSIQGFGYTAIPSKQEVMKNIGCS